MTGKCTVCGTTVNLLNSVDILGVMCDTDLHDFNEWADENPLAIYSEWPRLVRP